MIPMAGFCEYGNEMSCSGTVMGVDEVKFRVRAFLTFV